MSTVSHTVQIHAALPRPVCLCSHMSLCHALSQRVGPAGNQKVLTVWGDDMETGDCLQCLWFGAEQDARADDAVQEMARQKMEVALHRDYCKLQVPYRAVEPRIGGYATLPCLVCDMPAAIVHTQYIQLGLVNFNPRICGTELFSATRMHSGMPRSAEAERESASFLQDGKGLAASVRHVLCVSELSVVVARGRQPCLAGPEGLVVADRCRRGHGPRQACLWLGWGCVYWEW